MNSTLFSVSRGDTETILAIIKFCEQTKFALSSGLNRMQIERNLRNNYPRHYNLILSNKRIDLHSDSPDKRFPKIKSLQEFISFLPCWKRLGIKNVLHSERIKNIVSELGFKFYADEKVEGEFLFVNEEMFLATFVPQQPVEDTTIIDLMKKFLADIDYSVFNRMIERIHIDNQLT